MQGVRVPSLPFPRSDLAADPGVNPGLQPRHPAQRALRVTPNDLHKDCARLLVAGFEGTSLPPELANALSNHRLGGAILFARNLQSVQQTVELTSSIHACTSEFQPFVAIDQEGGRVQRLKQPPFTRIPPMLTVGDARDPRLAMRIGEAIGAELEVLGFNLNFAPVADVFTNPLNQVIGDRAFGRDPDTVARMAGAVMLGLMQSGVIPCAKHFPGHGDTTADSHHELPTVLHDAERLQKLELSPFQTLIRARVPMIMTAHVLVPAIDARHPATLSEQWIAQILRRQMKFGGVVVSDDLEMHAVADRYSIADMMEAGLHAGVDLFLICRTWSKVEAAFEALVRLGERSSRERDLIALAAGRIRQLHTDWMRPWTFDPDRLQVLGCDEHQALMQQAIDLARQKAEAIAADSSDPTDYRP
jgi:beta-N-acetylhexosaminidase